MVSSMSVVKSYDEVIADAMKIRRDRDVVYGDSYLRMSLAECFVHIDNKLDRCKIVFDRSKLAALKREFSLLNEKDDLTHVRTNDTKFVSDKDYQCFYDSLIDAINYLAFLGVLASKIDIEKRD